LRAKVERKIAKGTSAAWGRRPFSIVYCGAEFDLLAYCSFLPAVLIYSTSIFEIGLENFVEMWYKE